MLLELRSQGIPAALLAIDWLKEHHIEVIATEAHGKYQIVASMKRSASMSSYTQAAMHEMVDEHLGIGKKYERDPDAQVMPGNHAILILRDAAVMNMPLLSWALSYIRFATVSEVINRNTA